MYQQEFMSAREAAVYLGVKVGTLYSYVSRGLLRSVRLDPSKRAKGYRLADLRALKQRSVFRTDTEHAGEQVIDFGSPILTTGISMITEDGHFYRGVASADLARDHSFEQVAQFLWTGELRDVDGAWEERVSTHLFDSTDASLTTIERMQCVLPVLDDRDLASHTLRSGSVAPSAIRLMLGLHYLCTGRQRQANIATSLQRVWRADDESVAPILDDVLVLVADHELNIATFTARCAASAGAGLHQAVLAGLAALQGHRHLGGQVLLARRFFLDVVESANVRSTVKQYLRQGQLPGFHNPYLRLYPNADPRVDAMMERLRSCERFSLLEETVDLCQELTGEYPRIDFALAACEVVLELPTDAVFSLIALGRTAGIIAHVLEQYDTERIIRPRARYADARPR